MFKTVKLSSLKKGDWFYYSELEMVLVVYSRRETIMQCISSNGEEQLYNFKYCSQDADVEFIEVDSGSDWGEVYDRYPCFDEDIKNTMLRFVSKKEEYDLINSERTKIERDMARVSKDLTSLYNYLGTKDAKYKKIDRIKSDLECAIEEINKKFEDHYPDFK